MPTQQFDNVIERIRTLQARRQEHAKALAAIDAALQKAEVAVGGGCGDAVAEQPPLLRLEQLATCLPRAVRLGHKGKFSRTAEHSVLEFIRDLASPTTAEINAHWRAEGRKGKANVTLLKLLHQKCICRIADPTVRGSRYVLGQNEASNIDNQGHMARRTPAIAMTSTIPLSVAESGDRQVAH